MTSSPVFADVQVFIVREKFVVKEVAVLRDSGRELHHHIFKAPMSWDLLTKAEKSRVYWLVDYHHGLKWNFGYTDYRRARSIVRDAIRSNDSETVTTVYVKGSDKEEWLKTILGDDILADDGMMVMTMDAQYEDIGRLEVLDSAHAFRCGHHAKNCAMENVCKLWNWWAQRNRQAVTSE